MNAYDENGKRIRSDEEAALIGALKYGFDVSDDVPHESGIHVDAEDIVLCMKEAVKSWVREVMDEREEAIKSWVLDAIDKRETEVNDDMGADGYWK